MKATSCSRSIPNPSKSCSPRRRPASSRRAPPPISPRSALGRGETLQKSGAVAREEMDQLQNTLQTAKSSIEVEAAAVRGAELQLSYCTIHSPIRGRTGRRVIDAGNVVKAEETELVTVYQLRPVQVVFSVPEQHLTDIMREMRAGTLQVAIKPNENTRSEALGKLTFVDNTVRAATGTIDLKAEFPNEDLTLWPGQFGEVALTLNVQRDATVVPSSAVQTGPDQFLYLRHQAGLHGRGAPGQGRARPA